MKFKQYGYATNNENNRVEINYTLEKTLLDGLLRQEPVETVVEIDSNGTIYQKSGNKGSTSDILNVIEMINAERKLDGRCNVSDTASIINKLI